ncbi:protein kinase superfamily protein [Striga asiatica]|uniref:Protein kinase superfamily protein n=1 Tax=Striga asiatica TaxID=4170 RepID=A0A5A7R1M5_STRAF|nr:protein kinase superfamily protein [Striga asiatica]
MLAKESARFDIPEELLEVLPSDPFEQLDVARKITSIALSTRVDALESEVSVLRDQLNDRDNIISGLESQLESLDAAFNEASDKLTTVQQDKEGLIRENAQLSSTVKKLNRDVVKLEAFRKTLMRSLQDDEGNPASVPKAAPVHMASNNDDAALPPSGTASMQSQFSDSGSSNAGGAETEVMKPRVSHVLLLASQTSTPRLTPSGSPPSLSASVSPSRTPKPLSPRRHSISFANSRGFFDDKSSGFSSVPSSQFSSMSSLESGSQPGKARVDGKEFFRQVRKLKFQAICVEFCFPVHEFGPRTRLSYEQFGAFLANVKELNSHKQTKEETLRKADEIFGPDNKDLSVIFEGLITRNVH